VSTFTNIRSSTLKWQSALFKQLAQQRL